MTETRPSVGARDAAAATGAGPDRALLLIAAVLVLGATMTILDTTIVNVAIDTLSRTFDSSLASIQWVSGGYMLALATVIPLTGWAGDRFGTTRLFQFSVALFVLGSALAGAAWSAGSLIAFRVVQGLGGGMILPVAMTTLTRAAGQDRIGRVMGLAGIPLLLGPVIAPVIGGWLLVGTSWRWIFYINLPIGALTLLLAWRVLPRTAARPTERLDAVGLGLLAPGLVLLIFGLARSATAGGFGAAAAWLPMAAGAALIAAFGRHALTCARPLIDVRLFRHRAVAVAGLTQFFFAMAFFGTMLLIPLYFQVVRGESALGAGVLLTPYGLGAAIMMPVAGRITDRSGARGVVLVGLGLLAAGILGFTRVGAGTSYWLLAAAQLLLGLGMGATMTPAMSAAYQALAAADVAGVTTAINIIVRAGGACGTALLSVALTRQVTDRLHFDGGLRGLSRLPAGARERVAPTLAEAFGHAFWWALVLLLAAAVLATLLPGRSRRRSVR